LPDIPAFAKRQWGSSAPCMILPDPDPDADVEAPASARSFEVILPPNSEPHRGVRRAHPDQPAPRDAFPIPAMGRRRKVDPKQNFASSVVGWGGY